MRLTELEPAWIDVDGRHVAMVLLCPHCRVTRLSCFFVPERKFYVGGEWIDQYDLLQKFSEERGLEGDAGVIVGCKDGVVWHRTNDDFGSMTVTPSLDAGSSGHWHGSIVNGEIR